MRNKLLILIPLSSILLFPFLFTGKTDAAPSFNQSDIIPDAVFNSEDSMSAAQIDSFLNQFSKSCISQSNGFSAPDPTGYSPSGGFTYGSNVTAGQVIYDSGHVYGINPQVLLSTIEKEQSLVTGGDGCSTLRYAATAGYDCPDGGSTYNYSGVDLYSLNGSEVTSVSGTCVGSSLDIGFSQQIIRAAWLLKFGEERSEGNISWDIQLTNYPESGDIWNNSDDPQSCYSGPMTQGTWQICPHSSATYYDGYTTIDGQSIQMNDGATAALYWYTPHFSGNENFFSLFTSWFGESNIDVYPWEVAEASGGNGMYWLIVGNTKRWIPNASIYDDWGLDNYPLQQVSSQYLDTIPTIPQLGRLGQLSNGQFVFVDNGQKYILSSAAINDWGYSNSVALASPLYSVLSSMPTVGNANQYVQESGTSNYYLMSSGILYPISSSYISRWQITGPTIISTSSASLFVQSSALNYRLSISGQNYIVDLGKLLNVTPSSASAAYGSIASNFITVDPAVLPFFTTQQVSPLVEANNSPSWEFLIAGQQYYVLNPSIAHAWGVSSQPQIISSGLLAELTQGGNLSTQVQATDTGNFYILDGTKHLVASSLVPDWFGSSTTPMQLLDPEISVPQGSNINTPILQINGTPNVYTVMNGQFYYIQTGAILNGYGYQSNYQITNLNSSVLGSINYGGPINQYLSNGGITYYLQNGVAYPIASDDVGSWIGGSTVLAYPGTDFAQRFKPSSTQLTNLINASPQSKWLVNNGELLNINQYSDAYSFTSWTSMNITDLPELGPITYLARSATTPSDSRVWLVNNGTKQWIVNLEQFDGYGGAKMRIALINDSTLNAIPNSSANGGPSIIIQTGSSGLKLLMNGEYYAFPDGATVKSVVGNNPVANVSQSIYYAINQQAGTITSLIKDASTQKIYYMQDGQKCWITNSIAFARYSYIPVTTLPSEVVNWFPEGQSVN